MASPHQYTYSHPPPPAPHQRLPSIKELHFDKVGHPAHAQDGPRSQNGHAQMDHSRSARQEWPRPSPTNPAPTSQHQSNMSAPHESPKTQYPPPPKAADQYASPHLPTPHQAGQAAMGPNGPVSGASRADAPSQNPMKRQRSGSDVSVSVSPGRSHATYPQHAPYASQQPPPPSFQQGQPVPIPSHAQLHHHQPASFTHPPPGYGAYPPPPPHGPHRHYAVPASVPPPMHQPHLQSNSYPPPEHWPHAAPPPPQVQHQYATFPRPPPAMPANVDPRSAMPPPGDIDKMNVRQNALSEVYSHCRILQQWAHHYAQLQATHPNAQPSQDELNEMTWRANTVVQLLEELRRMPPEDGMAGESAPTSVSAGASEEHSRPPKRPWEDVSRDDSNAPVPNASYPDQAPAQYVDANDKSTAEADMEIIRSKRATSTGGTAPGQPKSKYRKRSRATPPGKCHSCNIRETPEWRRGPDGARTLCNACGLHYAKLMRKRDKGADGKPAPIDLQTLRASTQSARGSDPEQSHSQQQPQTHRNPSPGTPYDQQKQQPPPMHSNHHPSHPSPHPHSGPYQLMPVNAGAPPVQPHHMMPPPPPPSSHTETSMTVPPPPWMSSSSGRSSYTEHQSYMRASHPPSHARASPQ